MARASIGLTTVAADGTMHVRGWPVEPDFAEVFAVAMTAAYGEPDEMISDLRTMEAGGKRAADEGSAVFLLDPGGSNG
jgi:hypothetical protein